ncbi:hypothetical protein OGAPHI_002031 [Ogataea philodendri]|uniref:Kinesin motor domain-containing protein n=1 Tax=Ogataea philodendri TaxID=1378263 RepID=A0A9P8PBG1_9ASCO|nr:uncharacterized protein OGAPHI_002031 [Ogataea philodendri]KAH3668277.1 hypothetical protein OGAPHI_002031 [Ogataea philodendri]
MDLHLRARQFSGETEPVFVQNGSKKHQIDLPKYESSFGFKSVTQEPESLFETVGKPMLDDRLFRGLDCLLFTLGPSNSGKTHTVFNRETGMATKSLEYVFQRLSQYGQISSNYKKLSGLMSNLQNGNSSRVPLVDSEYAVTMSMFEIYNDSIKDILMNSTTRSRSFLDIITDPTDQKLKPYNLSQFLVSDYDSAARVLQRGLNHRKTGTTQVNRESSRSHCFVFINVVRIIGRVVNSSRLTIADLAGLERSKLSQTSGLNLKEGGFTNASLTQLGRCLELVATRQFNKSLLRTNKLTRLIFHDYVKNKSLISIIVTLDPAGDEGLILQTLRYVNPVQYQSVPRHISSASSQTKSSTDTKAQYELLCEIDTLKAYQHKLEAKVLKLEEEVVKTEVRVRQELYEENESKLNQIAVEHKNEVHRLTQEHMDSADAKLKEVSQCYQEKIESQIKAKEEELSNVKELVEELKQKCENLGQHNETLETEIVGLKEQDSEKLKLMEKQLEETRNESENVRKLADEAEQQRRKMESDLSMKESEIVMLMGNYDTLKAESASQQQNFEQELEKMKRQHESAIESQTKQHRDNMEALKTKYEQEAESLRERLTCVTKELEVNNIMMMEFQSTHDKQVAEMGQNDEKTAKELEAKEKQIDELKTKLQQLEAKSKKDIRDLRSQLESAKTKMSVIDSVDRSKAFSRSPTRSPAKSPYLFPTDLYGTGLNEPVSIFEDVSPQRESAVRKSPSRKKKKKADKAEQSDALQPTNKLVENPVFSGKHIISPTKSNRKKLRRVDMEEDLAISD